MSPASVAASGVQAAPTRASCTRFPRGETVLGKLSFSAGTGASSETHTGTQPQRINNRVHHGGRAWGDGASSSPIASILCLPQQSLSEASSIPNVQLVIILSLHQVRQHYC